MLFKRDKLALALPVFIYLVVVAVVMGSALWPEEGKLIFGDDIHRSYSFFRQYFAQNIRQGTVPWWNPYLFAGYPFAANPSVTMWYPPNWLFVILPYNQAFSLIIAGHLVLAMTAMYWLCRRWFDTGSSFLAGLVFGLSGYFLARIWAGHIDIISSAPYLPLVFGLFWALSAKPSLKKA